MLLGLLHISLIRTTAYTTVHYCILAHLERLSTFSCVSVARACLLSRLRKVMHLAGTTVARPAATPHQLADREAGRQEQRRRPDLMQGARHREFDREFENS